jgi:peptidoglycan/xylan/chitin deacetylase (PgdA/CDA1 family)
MYHYFYDPDLGESGLDANWMSIHSFEEQVRFLTENGYYFPDWEEVAGHVAGSVALPDKSVVIISDDGHESFFRLAIPVIERYGARATGAVIAKDYTREQLDAWRSDHIFFQSHSYDMHRGGTSGIGHNGRLLSATEEEIREDLALSEERIGTKAVYVYPFGDSTEFVRGVLRENGVRLAFTTQNGRCYPGQDPLLLPRVRMAGGQTIEGFAWLVR